MIAYEDDWFRELRQLSRRFDAMFDDDWMSLDKDFATLPDSEGNYSISYRWETGMNEPEIKVTGDVDEKTVNRFLNRMHVSGLKNPFKTPLLKGKSKGIEREPYANLTEEKETLTIHFELPGVDKKAIHLKVTPTQVDISTDPTNKKEIFHRTMYLPAKIDVDAVQSSYTDGMLEITLPKLKEQTPKERTVSIS